uniref:Uncharacterized protein n=1 Tax=Cacopsylla melanoneura TaxID=428564 RepID=A0A8D8V1A2_9HEMI
MSYITHVYPQFSYRSTVRTIQSHCPDIAIPLSGHYNPTVRTLQSHCPYITIPLSGLRTFNYKQSLNEYTTHNKCPNYNTGLQIRIGFQIRVFSHFSSFFFP